jgi:HEPN domain-containing protein
MYNFNVNKLLECLLAAKDTISLGRKDPDWLFEEARLNGVFPKLESIRDTASSLGLRLTRNKANLMITGLRMGGYANNIRAESANSNMKELETRLVEELEGYNFWHLAETSEYLRPQSEIIGTEIETAFPKAIEDLDEAAKCLAFERPTACVFHLMRSMELTVQRLYLELKIANPVEREWGKLLSDIEAAIDLMPKKTADERELKNKWSAAHTHLYHVKQAWRNDVMHPKQTYTLVEAKAIFEAVKSFMSHLANLL